jgi:hypothetical protein
MYIIFKDKKSKRSHKAVGIKAFLPFFCLLMKGFGSGFVQIITDMDPGGPKTYGFGSTTLPSRLPNWGRAGVLYVKAKYMGLGWRWKRKREENQIRPPSHYEMIPYDMGSYDYFIFVLKSGVFLAYTFLGSRFNGCISSGIQSNTGL